ncbi:NAD(P)/FAD-dependent oxidoreductase [Spartinivicinus poritis]|uniref:NAD(P)/FAD-dependent oxidoreductase n=1 Tax=Spartinivicinus poritis TaxID=2994640 RepID=A0ABT5UGA2_9GAMM|nr:NAD(P)/FAD-dependent oxidoreductase [Spartinivicinus sp. A2-2]MDE1465412.1 NAD(P)/FAD-dependent oxidoreductase [Spartinivicinus sp. A2-2]
MEQVDFTIVGAGVVGLAIAARLATDNCTTVIVEQHPHFGEEVSSRNSEVIHAGIYYPSQSLKAQLCVRGKELLYDYCQRYQIPYQQCGKLIVACKQEEAQQLQRIYQQAEANGVNDLQWLDKSAVAALEPAINCSVALLSPSSGIIDSHQLMLRLLTEAEQQQAISLFGTQVNRVEPVSDGFIVHVTILSGAGHQESYSFKTRWLINAAGLGAQQVAKGIEGLTDKDIPPLYYCKGHYFSLKGWSPFQHLIYPTPEVNTTGLGIHATLDLSGRVRFGPDTAYVDDVNYDVPESTAHSFYQAIKRYYPAINLQELMPAYAGIRPKLQGPGEPAKDFIIQTQTEHHMPGLINLFGIESPGLTAALAIAEKVAHWVSQ